MTMSMNVEILHLKKYWCNKRKKCFAVSCNLIGVSHLLSYSFMDDDNGNL